MNFKNCADCSLNLYKMEPLKINKKAIKMMLLTDCYISKKDD